MFRAAVVGLIVGYVITEIRKQAHLDGYYMGYDEATKALNLQIAEDREAFAKSILEGGNIKWNP